MISQPAVHPYHAPNVMAPLAVPVAPLAVSVHGGGAGGGMAPPPQSQHMALAVKSSSSWGIGTHRPLTQPSQPTPIMPVAPWFVSVQVARRATAAAARATIVVGAFVSRVDPPPHAQHITRAVKSSSLFAAAASCASIAAASAGDSVQYDPPGSGSPQAVVGRGASRRPSGPYETTVQPTFRESSAPLFVSMHCGAGGGASHEQTHLCW